MAAAVRELRADRERAGGPVHQLKVTLLETDPPIWRRLQVRSATTLAELHQVLQVTMGWENYHLHSFGSLAPRWERDDAGEARTTLAQVVRAGGRLIYVYDFGDCWEHEVLVEKVIERPRPGTVYPRCTGGRRTCPPEDCGGPPGFYAMLRALRHRKGYRYHEAREFLGSGRFDADAFDLVAVNRELAHLSPTPAEACAHCGRLFERGGRGRPRRYCSEACRARAYRRAKRDLPVDLKRPAEGFRLDGKPVVRRPRGQGTVLCACGCGRLIVRPWPGQRWATPACGRRAQRRAAVMPAESPRPSAGGTRNGNQS